MTFAKSENRGALHKLRTAGFGLIVLALSACATAQMPRGPEQVFSTPDQALDAFVSATRSDDKAELQKILGPNAADLITSGDPVADETGRERFLTAYDTAHELESEGEDEMVLEIGVEEWPLPIPLVRVEDGWQWNTEVGREEILNRRIGRNELSVIEVSRAYVEAQHDYAAMHRGSKGKPVYAQKFNSTKGKHDGLYWSAAPGKTESPLGPLVAEARAEGYEEGGKVHFRREPFHGYYFKILKQQGPNAPGGAKSYIHRGRMTGGFALLAFPAQYGDSGIMTFMVDQTGIVYEKNLGPDTAQIAATITQYDPDKSWKPQ